MWLKIAALSAVAMQMMSAQTWEITPFTSYLRLSSKPLGSLNAIPQDGDTRVRGLQPGYGVRFTANTEGYYGIEAGYSRSRGTLTSSIMPLESEEDDPLAITRSGSISLHQASINGVCYFMPNGERFRPYVTAGAQLSFWSNPHMTDWTAGNSRNIGVNYGGGLKIRLSKNLNIRADIRRITTGAPYGLSYSDDEEQLPRNVGWFNQLETSLGIGFTF